MCIRDSLKNPVLTTNMLIQNFPEVQWDCVNNQRKTNINNSK
jgi:hypothetical protein